VVLVLLYEQAEGAVEEAEEAEEAEEEEAPMAALVGGPAASGEEETLGAA